MTQITGNFDNYTLDIGSRPVPTGAETPMNATQAKALLRGGMAYIGDAYQDNEICLDGEFTIEQLKAIVFLIELEGANFSLKEAS